MSGRKKGGRPPGDYEVGYGRPPVASQFKKGNSGNNGGRPKTRKQPENAPPPISTIGRTPLQQLIHDELNRSISLQENGESIQLTATQATIRSLAIAAMKGRPQAQRALLELAKRAETDEHERRLYIRRLVAHYKSNHANIVKRVNRENPGKFCFLPHPEDVFYNEELGIMDFSGPFTEAARVGMMITRKLHNDILFAMHEILEIHCSSLLSRQIQEYAEELYNAAKRLNRELPARFQEDLAALSPEGWVQPSHDNVDPIYLGVIGPLPPGMLERLEAEPAAYETFAKALARFGVEGEPPTLNRTRHYMPAFGLSLNEPERRTILASLPDNDNAPVLIRKLAVIASKMLVPPYVIFNARSAIAAIESGRDVAVALGEFRQSLAIG